MFTCLLLHVVCIGADYKNVVSMSAKAPVKIRQPPAGPSGEPHPAAPDHAGMHWCRV
ncbi:hypothetical protein EMIT047CA2_100091 [Pseudomonas soli]